MRQDFPDGPRLGDECDEPDVTATPRALQRKLLPHPRHQPGPRNPRRVVRSRILGRVIRVTAASPGMVVARMPARLGIASLASIPDRQRRDGFPQPVIRCKHPVVAMPVLARRRHEIGEPVEELKRRELDDAIGSRPRGLPPTTPPDPVGRLVPREHVADLGDAAGWAAGQDAGRRTKPSLTATLPEVPTLWPECRAR